MVDGRFLAAVRRRVAWTGTPTDLRYAARLAVATTAATAAAVLPRVPISCLCLVLTGISMMAGTPEPYLGHQLRTTALVATGAFSAALAVLLLRVATDGHVVGTVVGAAAPLLLGAITRADSGLHPMPTVGTFLVGFLLISAAPAGRAGAGAAFGRVIADVALSVVLVVGVNTGLCARDGALEAGASLLARQLDRVGGRLSAAASELLATAEAGVAVEHTVCVDGGRPPAPRGRSPSRSPPPSPKLRGVDRLIGPSVLPFPLSTPPPSPRGSPKRGGAPVPPWAAPGGADPEPPPRVLHLSVSAALRGVPGGPVGFLDGSDTASVEEVDSWGGTSTRSGPSGILSSATVPSSPFDDTGSDASSEEGLGAEVYLTPAGSHTCASGIARAAELLSVGSDEPPPLRHWGPRLSVHAYGGLSAAATALLSRAATLEAVTRGHECSPATLRHYFSAAALPQWATLYARCAAATHDLAVWVEGMPAEAGRAWSVDPDLDARAWGDLRARLYRGTLLAFRRYWRQGGGAAEAAAAVSAAEAAAADPARGPAAVAAAPDAEALERVRAADVRAVLFAAVTSHGVATAVEAAQAAAARVAHVSKTTRPAAVAIARAVLSPLRDTAAHLRLLRPSLYTAAAWAPPTGVPGGSDAAPPPVLRRRLRLWQLAYALQYFLLQYTILAVVLGASALRSSSIVPSGEVAWTYSSAALAAQVSVEATLFISAIRVAATVAGATTALGLHVAVRSLPQAAYDVAVVVYLGAVAAATAVVTPSRLRYAGFLFIMTNGIVLLCPRGGGCVFGEVVGAADCAPDARYALSRAANVAAGVVAAMVVTTTVLPRFAGADARRELARAIGGAGGAYARIMRVYLETGCCKEVGGGTGDDDGVGWGAAAAAAASAAAAVAGGDAASRVFPASAAPGAAPHGGPSAPTTGPAALATPLAPPRARPFTAVHLPSPVTSVPAAADLATLLTSTVTRHLLRARLTLDKESGGLRGAPFTNVHASTAALVTCTSNLAGGLSEMTSVLSRPPVFSGAYRRSAHALFVAPLVDDYFAIMGAAAALADTIARALVLGPVVPSPPPPPPPPPRRRGSADSARASGAPPPPSPPAGCSRPPPNLLAWTPWWRRLSRSHAAAHAAAVAAGLAGLAAARGGWRARYVGARRRVHAQMGFPRAGRPPPRVMSAPDGLNRLAARDARRGGSGGQGARRTERARGRPRPAAAAAGAAGEGGDGGASRPVLRSATLDDALVAPAAVRRALRHVSLSADGAVGERGAAAAGRGDGAAAAERGDGGGLGALPAGSGHDNGSGGGAAAPAPGRAVATPAVRPLDGHAVPPAAVIPPPPFPAAHAADTDADAGDGYGGGGGVSLSTALAALDDPPLLRSDDAVLFHALVYASSASLDALTRIGRSLHGDLVRRAGARAAPPPGGGAAPAPSGEPRQGA
ncbi:hypothetical protein I4F81_009789 [Pyropia yezoensis]|uniref:Uncharacterized protein n=1 Tax=Pyropia yezoensis TaxID=2788 RepID=A0ACC3CBW0_PYRYE|nr:hypothetical protein I4F81_009789 [Neopyropia yezoensis]